MTKPRNLSISIPEPCTVPWNTMHTVDDYRRHCDSCATVVTDFSAMTDDELVSYLQNRAGQKTCGRFRKDQLGKPLPLLPEQKRKAIWWKAALLLPFSFIPKIGNAQQQDTLATQRQDSVLRTSSALNTDSLDQIIEPIAENSDAKIDSVARVNPETDSTEIASTPKIDTSVTLMEMQPITTGSILSLETCEVVDGAVVLGSLYRSDEEILASRFDSLKNIASFFRFFKLNRTTISADKNNSPKETASAILPQTTSISELNPRSRNRKPNNPTA
ncbi:MAG: hypothetical protein ACK5Z2_16500 [Bacteroidota bacterium]|jgi:hypothetical protein